MTNTDISLHQATWKGGDTGNTPPEKIRPGTASRYGRNALSYAAHKGHDAVVRLLLCEDNVNPDPKDQSGGTPLWYAARNGHAPVLRLLLNRSEVRGEEGRTPIWCAAAYGYDSAVGMFAATGRHQCRFSECEWCHTTYDCNRERHKMIAQLLLSREDVNPEFLHPSGWTALSLATKLETRK
jgi:ankyrin repeat protein